MAELTQLACGSIVAKPVNFFDGHWKLYDATGSYVGETRILTNTPIVAFNRTPTQEEMESLSSIIEHIKSLMDDPDAKLHGENVDADNLNKFMSYVGEFKGISFNSKKMSAKKLGEELTIGNIIGTRYTVEMGQDRIVKIVSL